MPKQINDSQSMYDTISVNLPGYIFNPKINLSLNHQNDGDLIIQLLKPGTLNITLSSRNGPGGQNYTNTTFDDSATVSITQGTPPFSGSFKPQSPLGVYNNKPIAGNWILKVTDVAQGNQGTMISWCILAQTKTVSIHEEYIPAYYDLSQNYPNPFNSSTRISYSIPNNSDVSLTVYDLLGREVRTLVNEHQNAGNYVVMFNSGNMASGVYFYRLSTENYTEIRRMVIIK